jgi:hypothetical protein
LATYFGNEDITGSEDYGNSGVTKWISAVCPGSGNQTIKELSGYFSVAGGNIRVAIYSDDRNTKIAEGVGEVAVAASYAWQGHLTQASISPNPATLVGGVTYTITASQDDNSTYTACATGNFTYGFKSGVDYTGGFPATLFADTEMSHFEWCMRCGVDAAAAGSILPLVGFGTLGGNANPMTG